MSEASPDRGRGSGDRRGSAPQAGRLNLRGHAHFDLGRLRQGLAPMRLFWFPRLRSSNDHAAVLRRKEELYAPAVVVAGRQTSGRGRGSNEWWSGAGSLTVTFVVPADEHLAPYQVSLAAGLAVRNAAAELAGNEAITLKWPNDLLFDGRKLAGLLCERVDKADLIGLGLNVNGGLEPVPRGLRGQVAFLSEAAGRRLDLTDCLALVARRLHVMMKRRGEQPFSHVLGEYGRHDALAGRRVVVVDTGAEIPVSGTCQGLDSIGRLLVKSGRTIHRVIAGQVRAVDKSSSKLNP